jgi:thermitase
MSNQPQPEKKEILPLKPVRHSVAIVAIALMLSLSLHTLIQSIYGVENAYTSLLLQLDDQQANAIATQRRASAPGQSDRPVVAVVDPNATDRIIVKFRDRDLPPGLAIATEKANLEQAQGLKLLTTIPGISAQVYQVSETDTADEVVNRLLASKGDIIEYAEIDFLVGLDYMPNDPDLSRAWHINRVQAPLAWDSTSGSNIIIAIADTGVDCSHPDLTCVAGWNTASNNDDTTDINGHGTAVAGVAAQIGDNSRGSAGIAYSAKIMPMRVTNSTDGGAYVSSIASAITWAADRGARVANASYGICGSVSAVNAANYMRSKGGVVTISAGNTGGNPGHSQSSSLTCVSATASNDTRPSWSSFGAYVDVAAPGASVYTTNRGGGYGSWSGTSFAAPLTAGIYALLFANDPNLTPVQADSALFSSADDLGDIGWDMYYGWGRVNAGLAVAAVSDSSGTRETRDSTAPSVPTNLRITDVRSGVVALAWDASKDDSSGIAGYSVFRDGARLTTLAGTSYSDSGLLAKTTYTYTVRAEDNAGNISNESDKVSVTTPDIELAISSQSVTTKTSNSATIAVNINKPGNVSIRYGTDSRNLNLSTQSTAGGTSHVVQLSGLSARTTYYYQIVVTDLSNSLTSPVYNFKTSNASGGGGGSRR